MRKINVMVVDDESPIADAVEIMVNRQVGFRVIAKAFSGKEALQIFKEQIPDILICDIKMPNMSGLELLKKIDEMRQNANFIIMSGYSDFQYAREAIKYNVWEYLLKPVDENELKKTLKNIADNIIQVESKKSLIFGSDKLKDAACDADVKTEAYKIISGIDETSFKAIHQRVQVFFSKLEKEQVTNHTLEALLDALGKQVGVNLGEILHITENYEDLIDEVLLAIKREDKFQISLSAKEIVGLLEYQIKANYSKSFDGKEIFEQFGYNEVYLNNLFKKQKGITPKQLQRKIRIEKAKEIMDENPKVLLKTVAEMVGYSDQLYFSKIFKEVMGVSPKKYLDNKKAQH